MSKMYFTKEYERDVSLIVEALWAQKLTQFISDRLGIKTPFESFIIFYATDENLQIWEHAKALSWYKDRLLEENQEGDDFIKEVILKYEALLAEIKVFWEKGPTADRDKLKEYMKLSEEAFSLFSVWYYSLTDDRTPNNVRKLLVDLRNKDEFFSRNDSFVKDCVKALGGKRDYANLIFPEEFPDLPRLSVLKTRARGVVSVDGKEYFFMSLNKFASAHSEYFFEGLADNLENIQEIKGQVAFEGKAKGIARIIKNKKQMRKIRDGEILVSPMTTPDFMPAMKKAVAFVTDEGGILCHAAIVARELKKPCIIGTKIATQVLKDGDLVEVDAVAGIVKKL
jgi:phosphohistidine swiveling domain-containing protein